MILCGAVFAAAFRREAETTFVATVLCC